MCAGVMHTSNDIAATDAETFQHGGSDSLSADVKCEPKMEVDDRNLWPDVAQKIRQSNPASDTPGEVRPTNVLPGLGNVASSSCEPAGEQPYPVSRLSSFVGSFHNGLQHSCPNQAWKGSTGNGAGVSAIPTGSDKTLPEAFLGPQSGWKESSRNIDGMEDHRMSGSRHNGEVTAGLTIVGHQAGSHDRLDELILSTPFGTFHRAPLSFWPVRSTGEQTTSSSHNPGMAESAPARSINTGVCDVEEQTSRDRRGTPLSSQHVTTMRNETNVPRKVISLTLDFLMKLYMAAELRSIKSNQGRFQATSEDPLF